MNLDKIRMSWLQVSACILFSVTILNNGCVTNPATKRKEFMIVSEKREFGIGKDADKQVREEMGVYLELPELRNMVKSVGERIGQNSDRPDLIYRFEIVDSPVFNAFAIPGGFVYVTRGLLERMNSADGLAAVLGHEIAHVAARHSAAQISKSQLFNIGMIGVSMATGGSIREYDRLINLGAYLTFNKFSRDDEREADKFGIRYMVQAGYNPRASIEVMHHMKDLETKEPSSLDVWFRTHPATSERISNLTEEIDTIGFDQPAALKRDITRNQYLALLDGLVVGEWNGSELVSGNRYYNKEYLMSLEVPQNWIVQIRTRDYTAIFVNPKAELAAYLQVEPLMEKKTTGEYFKDFDERLLRGGWNKVEESSRQRPLNHEAAVGIYMKTSFLTNAGNNASGFSDMKPKTVENIAFVRGTNGYSLMGICDSDKFDEIQPLLESMINSLQFISEEKADTIQPPRLRIHRVADGESWESVSRQYFDSAAEKEKLAEYNGFDIKQMPAVGDLIKIPPTLRIR